MNYSSGEEPQLGDRVVHQRALPGRPLGPVFIECEVLEIKDAQTVSIKPIRGTVPAFDGQVVSLRLVSRLR